MSIVLSFNDAYARRHGRDSFDCCRRGGCEHADLIGDLNAEREPYQSDAEVAAGLVRTQNVLFLAALNTRRGA